MACLWKKYMVLWWDSYREPHGGSYIANFIVDDMDGTVVDVNNIDALLVELYR